MDKPVNENPTAEDQARAQEEADKFDRLFGYSEQRAQQREANGNNR